MLIKQEFPSDFKWPPQNPESWDRMSLAFGFVFTKLHQKELVPMAKICRGFNKIIKAGYGIEDPKCDLFKKLTEPTLTHESPLAPFFNSHFSQLFECVCLHATMEQRDEIIQEIIKKIPPPKTQYHTIHLQSVGFGGGLRELVLTVHVYMLGYRDVVWQLIDPGGSSVYSNWISKEKLKSKKITKPAKTIADLKKFLAIYLPLLEFEMEYNPTVSSYLQKRKLYSFKPDVLLMIDIDFEDILNQSFHSLSDAKALKKETIIGWTQHRSITQGSTSTSHVKSYQEKEEIKKVMSKKE